MKLIQKRAVLLLTVGVLFCSLATIELGELLRLVDDTSNDFALSYSQRAGDSELQSQGSRAAADPVVRPIRKFDHNALATRFVSRILSPSTAEVLHSLCIQRT